MTIWNWYSNIYSEETDVSSWLPIWIVSNIWMYLGNCKESFLTESVLDTLALHLLLLDHEFLKMLVRIFNVMNLWNWLLMVAIHMCVYIVLSSYKLIMVRIPVGGYSSLDLAGMYHWEFESEPIHVPIFKKKKKKNKWCIYVAISLSLTKINQFF